MAWVATDNFDSYSIGALNGNNGGSGFSAGWSGNTLYLVETSTTFQGANAVGLSPISTEPEIGRNLTTATTDGSVHIAMRKTSNSVDADDFWVNEGGLTIGFRVFGVQFTNAGQIAFVGSASNNQQAYNANQWYEIDFEYDCSTDQFRGRIDGGAWSIFYGFRTAETNLTDCQFQNNNSAATVYTVYWDDLRPTTSAAVASVFIPQLLTLGVG